MKTYITEKALALSCYPLCPFSYPKMVTLLNCCIPNMNVLGTQSSVTPIKALRSSGNYSRYCLASKCSQSELWTAYYGQFSQSLHHTFSLKLTCLIQTIFLVDMVSILTRFNCTYFGTYVSQQTE